MRKKTGSMVYDEGLHLEAWRFKGMMQSFPNHFHEYYVTGFVERGARRLSCRNREYDIERGSILLFNPGDNHACAQSDGGTFDYRGFHIPKETMLELTEKITGKRMLPVFRESVITDGEVACCLETLHEMIMKKSDAPGREESLLLMISLLIRRYGGVPEDGIPECRQEVEEACRYMKQHAAERICLDQICRHAGLGSSTLLRAFTREKGITPYRYLETIRINEAKRLLSEGMPPVEAAMWTGFSDQSHFTNCFGRYMGLAPGIYRESFSRKAGDGPDGIAGEKTHP